MLHMLITTLYKNILYYIQIVYNFLNVSLSLCARARVCVCVCVWRVRYKQIFLSNNTR